MTVIWTVARGFFFDIVGARRALALFLPCAIPAALLLVLRHLEPTGPYPPDRAAWWDLRWIDAANLLLQGIGLWICFSLAPLVVTEEASEGGLPYLLTRPIPKTLVFLPRLLAAGGVAAAALTFGQILAALAAHVGPWEALMAPGPRRSGLLHLAGIQAAAAFLYTALGALLALVTTRPLVWGMAYFFFGEMILANTHGLLAKTTLLFHVRSLVARGLPGIHEILQRELLFPIVAPARAAGRGEALAVVGGVLLAAMALSAWQFSRREWTPPERE